LSNDVVFCSVWLFLASLIRIPQTAQVEITDVIA